MLTVVIMWSPCDHTEQELHLDVEPDETAEPLNPSVSGDYSSSLNQPGSVDAAENFAWTK